MRILVAYTAIDNIAGGVERMSITLMNELVRRGHEVHFYTLDHKNALSFYFMNEQIIWHKLDMGDYRVKASWKLRFKRALTGRKILQTINPDVILAFQDGAYIQMLAYSLGLKIPLILAERIAPSHFDFSKKRVFKNLYFKLYNLADAITVQCASYVNQYPAYLRSKITVIPNPVEPVEAQASPSGVPGQRKALLCVGRIGFQKNQMALIDAFSNLQNEFPEWTLVLAGSEDNDEARQRASALNTRVEFLGPVQDVGTLYESSHLFCLPSRWEGFPNALAEALSYGLPAVGFAECGGVRDLIIPGETGLLATGNDDVSSLHKALLGLMKDDALRGWMGLAAKQSVTQYEPRAIFDRWEVFLKSVSR